MIVKPLEFRWVFGNDRVSFTVYEPYEHQLVCFFGRFCESNKRSPNLGEWIGFYKKAKAPESLIKTKIKLFNKYKKSESKKQVDFDKIYSKVACTGKAKKVVKKKN